MTEAVPRWRGMVRRGALATAIATGAIGVGALGLLTDRLDAVQTRWEDALQPGLRDDPDGRVVVVAIDRATIAELGTGWPIERTAHADLIDAIAEAEPAAIVYDVLFAREQPGDAELASAIGGAPLVLAAALELRAQPNGAPVVVDQVVPIDRLAEAAVAVGHANVRLAPDTGVVRALPLFAVDDRGIAIPSLALAGVALADGSGATLVERPGGVQIGGRLVPARGGDLPINWSSALDSDDATSAIDVVQRRVDPALFRDRIVVVGVTEQTIGDQHLVPVDRSGSTSGVFVIANAINTIVVNGYLSEPGRGSELAVLLVVGAATALLFGASRLSLATAITVAVLALFVVVVSWRFHHTGERWNVVWPVLTAGLVATGLSGWRYLVEIRHRHRAWNLFATYVPARVVADLADRDRLDGAVRSQRRPISVVFCDLRGFTPVAASLDPDDVRRLLDHYYEYAVAIVHAHGGTVMQFVGDEVFAVFGAPLDHADSARSAIVCAIELLDRVSELDEGLAKDGLPPVRFGIGVHRGLATTAHVGTNERRQYSAIGDTVNVGSRLCGNAGPGEVVASTAAVEGLTDDLVSRLVPAEPVALKGVAAPVPIRRASASPAQ